METCDVLIVGGGPGGSTCAWKLKQAGLDVVVMDKKAFPRDKVCAGWITPAVIEELRLDMDDYRRDRVLQPISGFRTRRLGDGEAQVLYDQPVSYGIRRREFDHYLLQRSGARLALGEPLTGLERRGSGWVVNGRIATPMVIGAGGHFCPVARFLGAKLGSDERVVAAQEIEFALDARQREACAVRGDVPELYFCTDLKGYGWCFRKGDYLNVGLGREDNHKLAEHVQAFCEFLQREGRIPSDIPRKFSGHAYLLYPYTPRTPLDDGVLLVGDAAGLAYPQSGEGIRPAIESGLLAAQTLVAARGDYRRASLEPYRRALIERFGKPGAAAGGVTALLPEGLKQRLAGKLLGTSWFARHVVVDRWFLHAHQASLTSA